MTACKSPENQQMLYFVAVLIVLSYKILLNSINNNIIFFLFFLINVQPNHYLKLNSGVSVKVPQETIINDERVKLFSFPALLNLVY